jgi:HindIII restriction endonuclease
MCGCLSQEKTPMPMIDKAAETERASWISTIQNTSGNFLNDFVKIEKKLNLQLKKEGLAGLLNHLRLCGDIPESYSHDSSEEKLYSKYTDALLSEAFTFLGLKSIVVKERGDAADVEVIAKTFSFVADAKAFRLSRTAKNQKDFKITAMHEWKRGKPYALVVCPIYQLPSRSSQIYQQACARNVCILSYSHLAVLCAYAQDAKKSKAEKLLLKIFESLRTLNPSKDSVQYWCAINRTILDFDKSIPDLWDAEKLAALESISIAKGIALTSLAQERERILRMPRKKAIQELLNLHKIDSRVAQVRSVSDSGLMEYT